MTRSLWKGPFFDKIYPLEKRRIESRRSTILPSLLEEPVQVWNGKRYQNIRIVGELIGHRFGEFANTRRKVIHKKKQKKKK